MKSHVRVTLCIAVVLAFTFNMFHPTAAPAADKRQTLQEFSDAFAEIAGQASRMVVAIKVEQVERHSKKGEHYWAPFEIPRQDGKFRYFYHQPDWESQEFHLAPEPPHFWQNLPDTNGFGSGILLDDEGHIATAANLVGDSREIVVTIENTTRRTAKLIGVDKNTGIAVIKIDSDAISKPNLVESEQVAVGELALDLRHTKRGDLSVALGIISGTGRQMPVGKHNDLIEISTNLRSRSSGGAVVNASGEVIGMGVGATSDGAFAIPIRTVTHIAAELIEHGKVERGWLGVAIKNVQSEMAEKLRLETPKGALIWRVLEGTPAAKAGLKINDVIVTVDDDAIANVKHLQHVIAMAKPDSTVSLTIIRAGEKLEIPVTLGERTFAAMHRSSNRYDKRQSVWKGLSLQTLTQSLAEAFGYETHEGVLIAGVEPDSPAAEAASGEEKLQKGDLILEVEDQPVQNVDAFKTAVQTDKKPILLRVKRGEQMWYVTVN